MKIAKLGKSSTTGSQVNEGYLHCRYQESQMHATHSPHSGEPASTTWTYSKLHSSNLTCRRDNQSRKTQWPLYHI